jgi:hypothetical protein
MDERFRSLTIIWFALIGGVATWAAVAFCLVALGIMDESILPRTALPITAAAAAVVMAFGIVLRRRMVEAIPRGLGVEERFTKYQAAAIQGWALIEGGGLLLLVIGLISAAPVYILTGGIAAIVALVLARPTREEAGLSGPGG